MALRRPLVPIISYRTTLAKVVMIVLLCCFGTVIYTHATLRFWIADSRSNFTDSVPGPEVRLDRSVTVVTAFYRMKSKFSHDTYVAWMSNFLGTIPCHLYVFTEQESLPMLRNLRMKFLNRTKFVIRPFSQLKMAQRMKFWKQQRTLDHESAYGHTPELYVIWNEKPRFLLETIQDNAFDSDYFLWTDIGAFRSQHLASQLTTFPSTAVMAAALGTEKVFFLLMHPFEESEKQVAANGLPVTGFQRVIRLGGGIFGGHARAVVQFEELYYRTMELMRVNRLFVGKDQNVMATVAVLHPELVLLVQPQPYLYGADPWFYSEYFLSDRNVLDRGMGRQRESGGSSEPRILCMIIHKAGNDDRAEAILATWVKRCDGHVFISTQQRPGSPTVVLKQKESRTILWAKVQAMLRYANSQRNAYDWFLKADDDAYFVMENLRQFLSNRSTLVPVYVGTEFKKVMPFHPPTGYMSGGSGYVFSRKAVQLLVGDGFDRKVCNLTDDEVEEVKLEECAVKVGVSHDGNTLDQQGRGRFFPYAPERHFTPGNEDLGGWLRYPNGRAAGCCSDSAISFHYITPTNMYILDYLIYVLRPHGFDNALLST